MLLSSVLRQLSGTESRFGVQQTPLQGSSRLSFTLVYVITLRLTYTLYRKKRRLKVDVKE